MSDSQQAPDLPAVPVTPEPKVRSRTKVIITVVAAALAAVLAFAGITWALSSFGQSAAPVASDTPDDGTDEPVDDIEGISYENAEYGYSVVFPAAPTESSQNIPIQGYDIELETVLWEDGDQALVVNATRFPPELLGDVDTMLDGSVSGAIGNVPGARLVSSTPTTLDGIPARDVQATTSAGPLHMIIAIDEDVQYQLLAGNTDEDTAQAFFASFAQL